MHVRMQVWLTIQHLGDVRETIIRVVNISLNESFNRNEAAR